MPVTGFVLPTARTVEAGSGTWINDANILADDASVATFSLNTKNTTGRWLAGQTFGLGALIPAGSVIDAVEIRAEWHLTVTLSVIAQLELQAFVSGAAVGAVRQNVLEPGSPTIDTFDITADRSWTRADLLDGTFELKCRGTNGNDATDPGYLFDYIAVQVTYSAAPGIPRLTVAPYISQGWETANPTGWT